LTVELDGVGVFAGYSNNTCMDLPYELDPTLTLPAGASASVAGGGAPSGPNGCSSAVSQPSITGTATITVTPLFSPMPGQFSFHAAFDEVYTYFDPNPPNEPEGTFTKHLTSDSISVTVKPSPDLDTPSPATPCPSGDGSWGRRGGAPNRFGPPPTPCPSGSPGAPTPTPTPSPNLVIVEEAVPQGRPTYIISSPYPGPSPITIGQQVRLGVRETHGYPVSNISWIIPQPAIYGFDQNAEADPIATFPPNALQSPDIAYYWTYAVGPSVVQPVWVTAFVNGRPMTSMASYPLFAPSNVQINGVLGDVAVDRPDYSCTNLNDKTAYWLHIGYPCVTGKGGIQWKYTAMSSAKMPDSGILELVQLFDSSIAVLPLAKFPTLQEANLSLGVDLQFPYSNVVYDLPVGKTVTYQAADSPTSPLHSTICSMKERSDVFIDYFMYQPTSTSSRSSIPVDIGILDWTWQGTASYSPLPAPTPPNGGWHLLYSAMAIPTPTPLPAMPTWTQIWTKPNVSAALEGVPC
jgi:hypothetical protein